MKSIHITQGRFNPVHAGHAMIVKHVMDSAKKEERLIIMPTKRKLVSAIIKGSTLRIVILPKINLNMALLKFFAVALRGGGEIHLSSINFLK